MDLDDFPDGVVIAGADGVVEYVNERIERMARAALEQGVPLLVK